MNVGVAEAKDRLSELIERVERGEPVTITRHGKPVATLAAARRRPNRAELEALMAEVDADRAKLAPITTEEIIDAIRADRRW